MFGFLLFTWTGSAIFGVYYFSWYSWDKHPVLLGICAFLLTVLFAGEPLLSKRITKQTDASLLAILFFLSTALLIMALEYIESGGIDFTFLWTEPRGFKPFNAVHFANMTMLLVSILQILRQLGIWSRAKREEYRDKESGKDALIREAIARFDPATMIADEPVAEALPFPRRWIWILGLYASAIVVLYCIGVWWTI
jgi:hypothetical protein